MAKATLSMLQTKNEAEHVSRQAAASPAASMLARLGYAARGVVYAIIGILAARVALGDGGATTDRKGALEAIYQQPFGQLLLWVVTVGLAGYVLWCAIRAIFDPDGRGSGKNRLGARLMYVGIGISYGLLAAGALRLLLGAGNAGKSSDSSTRDWTIELLKQPFGQLLVALVGLGGLAFAGWQFVKAYKASFQKHMELARLGQMARTWVVRLGRFGYAARGVVAAIIGIFLIVAAVHKDAKATKGLGGSLKELAHQPFGHLLLGIVALGLVAFGLFSFAQARYRHIGTVS